MRDIEVMVTEKNEGIPLNQYFQVTIIESRAKLSFNVNILSLLNILVVIKARIMNTINWYIAPIYIIV